MFISTLLFQSDRIMQIQVRVDILLTWGKRLDAWAHKLSLTSPLGKYSRSCICVLGVSILCLFLQSFAWILEIVQQGGIFLICHFICTI
jgi:hypothetical protein